jgi:hypothetical protein
LKKLNYDQTDGFADQQDEKLTLLLSLSFFSVPGHVRKMIAEATIK